MPEASAPYPVGRGSFLEQGGFRSVAGSIGRLSGLCDAVRTMLRALFLYLVRINSLIRPNDTISGMALK